MSGILQKAKNDEVPWEQQTATRQIETRQLRRRFLVISEGGETEPIYFKAFERILPSGTVKIETCGTGRNTLSLVKEVASIRARLERKLGFAFDEVWTVFDKDSFKREDFDNAIHSCVSHKYGAAWSNECFEIWYLLHFNNRQTGVGRDAIFRELEKEFNTRGYRRLKGKAGLSIHEGMAKHANQGLAITRAKRLFLEKNPPGQSPEDPPSRQNPCTTVYKLVEKLLACRPKYLTPTENRNRKPVSQKHKSRK